jgi:hypothetical protein
MESIGDFEMWDAMPFKVMVSYIINQRRFFYDKVQLKSQLILVMYQIDIFRLAIFNDVNATIQYNVKHASCCKSLKKL